jgi:hypothetical protein
VVVAVAAVALSSTAAAESVTVGSSLANSDNTTNSCPLSGCTYLQQGVVSPFDGVITRWGFRSGNHSTFTLRVLHTSNGGSSWSALRSSSPVVNMNLGGTTFVSAAVPVAAGDGIGVSEIPGGATDNSPIHAPATGSMYFWNSVLADGGAPASAGPGTGVELLLQATIDPVAISINEHPKAKVKTRKKKVGVSFSFSSNASGNAPGTGFQCKLDGAAFTLCSSPFTARARRGAHTFTVESTLNGAKFGDPASFGFKVKRKKKR